MSIRQFAFPVAMAAAAAFAIPGASRAETQKTEAPCPMDEAMEARPPCFLEEIRVISVRPQYGFSALQGAKLELLPANGISTETLAARLQQALRAKPLPACLVDVGQVEIGSNAVGEASSVTLIAKDPKNAERVLRRANQLKS